MKFKIKGSESFEITKLDINTYKRLDSLIESKTRHGLAIGIVSFIAIFLSASAVYGAIVKDFTALSAVSEYIQLPIGILLGYYFGVKKSS